MKTTRFILTALAHLSSSEELLVTFFYFQFIFFFYCKIRHSFEFMCVLKNQPCFRELRLASSVWLLVDVEGIVNNN